MLWVCKRNEIFSQKLFNETTIVKFNRDHRFSLHHSPLFKKLFSLSDLREFWGLNPQKMKRKTSQLAAFFWD
jgi:hypothetical protein